MVQVKDNGPIAVLSRPGFETIAASEVRPIVWSFELAHDESFVVFATEEGIHRLDTDDWSETLIVPTDERVRGIAVSPDNTLVMLGGTDGFVHIHNVQTGELVDQIAEEWVSDGHWIDESRIVVGTGLTGVWTVLDLDIHRVALAALGQLTRGFTTGECLRFGIDPCPTLDDMRSAIGVP